MPGRFAPSPTGALHVGSLRTALAAWLHARAAGDRFLLRSEDLDRVTSSPGHEQSQQADLRALGIDWDGPVWRQSERFDLYHDALATLTAAGLTYECYCSRREIREAASAPHGGELIYPGTCRRLTDRQRADRRRSRPAAIRLRASVEVTDVDDLVAGVYRGAPWDVVLRRNDGVPAYNLAVVVDDAASGVDTVIRGADLLPATPSHAAIARALRLPEPTYGHVAMVVGADGQRLAKRDGAINLADLDAAGLDVDAVRTALAASLGVAEPTERVEVADLVARFDLAALPDRQQRTISVEQMLAAVAAADRK